MYTLEISPGGAQKPIWWTGIKPGLATYRTNILPLYYCSDIFFLFFLSFFYLFTFIFLSFFYSSFSPFFLTFPFLFSPSFLSFLLLSDYNTQSSLHRYNPLSLSLFWGASQYLQKHYWGQINDIACRVLTLHINFWNWYQDQSLAFCVVLEPTSGMVSHHIHGVILEHKDLYTAWYFIQTLKNEYVATPFSWSSKQNY